MHFKRCGQVRQKRPDSESGAGRKFDGDSLYDAKLIAFVEADLITCSFGHKLTRIRTPARSLPDLGGCMAHFHYLKFHGSHKAAERAYPVYPAYGFLEET